MLESSIIGTRTINCYRHKTQTATHLCTDCKCNNNPILCMQCFVEQVNRHYHYDHEKSILPFSEGVQNLSSFIKGQMVGGQKIYKTITGRNEFNHLILQIQKGQLVYDELGERITSIKSQVEIELELLVKEFQKVLMIEKQEYFKLLDNYQKIFVKNIDYLKSNAQILLDFNNSVKYYSNKNNFYLKMVTEAHKKSDWISKMKKNLQNLSKNLQNINYSTEITNTFNSAINIKLDVWPTWKGQDNASDRANELKQMIKKALNQWVYIPEIKSIDESSENGYHHLPNLPATGSVLKNYYGGTNTR